MHVDYIECIDSIQRDGKCPTLHVTSVTSYQLLVSLSRLSVGCVTTEEDSLVTLPAFEYYPVGPNNAATSLLLINPAVIRIL